VEEEEVSAKQPPIGRLSERSIRSTLNCVKRQLRAKDLKPSQALKLLNHQERLMKELREVLTFRLKEKIARESSGAQ
jgi:hypothetical protein